MKPLCQRDFRQTLTIVGLHQATQSSRTWAWTHQDWVLPPRPPSTLVNRITLGDLWNSQTTVWQPYRTRKKIETTTQCSSKILPVFLVIWETFRNGTNSPTCHGAGRWDTSHSMDIWNTSGPETDRDAGPRCLGAATLKCVEPKVRILCWHTVSYIDRSSSDSVCCWVWQFCSSDLSSRWRLSDHRVAGGTVNTCKTSDPCNPATLI